MEQNGIDKVIWEKLKVLFHWWKRLYTINDDDHLLVILVKVFIRLIGIAILIAMSPFAIFGVVLAFLFVG